MTRQRFALCGCTEAKRLSHADAECELNKLPVWAVRARFWGGGRFGCFFFFLVFSFFIRVYFFCLSRKNGNSP